MTATHTAAEPRSAPAPGGPVPQLPLPPHPRGALARAIPSVTAAMVGLTDDTVLATAGERFGGVFRYRDVPGLGRVVIATDPEAIRQLYTAKPSQVNTVDGQKVTELAYGSQSLFLLDGPPHHRLRRILTPPFRGEALEAHRATMEAVIGRAIDALPAGEPFRLLEVLHRATAEIIVRICMGIDDERRLAEWVPAMQAFAHIPTSSESTVRQMLRLVVDLPWPKFERVRTKADSLLYAEIARRRAAGGLEEAGDILAVLLRSTTEDGELLTDVEIRDQLVTLLLAGHETTATTGAWAMERVVRHPEVLRRLTAEALDGTDDTYAKAVTQETLRTRPPLVAVMRRTVADFELAGYRIPRDTWVITPFRAIHRNAGLFPEPDAFRPERFLEQSPPMFGWVPFGGGPHTCLGMHFAMLELRVVLHELLRRVEVRAADPRDEKVKVRSITLVPQHGVRLVITRRRDPAPA